MLNQIKILAIESSCDETSAAVSCNRNILSNVIASQKVHEAFGGVVPELASREHMKNIIPVVDLALKKADTQLESLNAIAFTRGPGLIGPLLVGSTFAKTLALSLKLPLIEVNHMHAHVLAHLIEKEGQKIPELPFLCLVVSGGHTQIVKVDENINLSLVGETSDDAAGEAFDKVAKLLRLPYPGGPLIDQYAKSGNPNRFEFPKSKMSDYTYSFSGFKTAVMNFINKESRNNSEFVAQNLNDICASVQLCIIDMLMDKFLLAAENLNIKNLAIAGGVSANSQLRYRIAHDCDRLRYNSFIPLFEFCTDNAGMIAIAAYYKFLRKDFALQDITPLARYEI